MKGLFDLVKPLLWYVAVIGAVVYGIHLNREDGKDEGYRLGKSEGETAVAVLRQEYALEKQRTSDTALAQLRTEQDKGNELATQLADAKETLRHTTDRLSGEIARVTTLYRRALDAKPEPLPVAVFTNGFVRVWNTANGIAPNPAMPTTNGSGRTPSPASGAGTADDLDSGVTQEQLLTNQVRNGELYGICRAQLRNLINWTRNESK
ncbi:putative lipoprotein [Pseudomonas sp. R4-39-08]|uniref:DNA-packaging protein n=1 Tax=Pseudomonas TaxID=286 RepID=UPI000F587C6F|nr:MULTISPECIES: DNA-packaging protein [Pseudomonas]AZF36223.1 putative lipoprotein [Pseudomonas sp. R4-39-08]MDQ0980535.1 hypothetical protein [Pseudomonas synxantha]